MACPSLESRPRLRTELSACYRRSTRPRDGDSYSNVTAMLQVFVWWLCGWIYWVAFVSACAHARKCTPARTCMHARTLARMHVYQFVPRGEWVSGWVRASDTCCVNKIISTLVLRLDRITSLISWHLTMIRCAKTRDSYVLFTLSNNVEFTSDRLWRTSSWSLAQATSNTRSR